MFKRLFWLSLGASIGFGSSWWVTKTVKQKIERYAPARLTAGVANTTHAVTGGVKAALADGREAMHDREAELRAEFDAKFLPPDRKPERKPERKPDRQPEPKPAEPPTDRR
jgi:hypothetical protein